MRVVCIKDPTLIDPPTLKSLVEVGGVYDVLRIVDVKYYELSIHRGYAYNQKLFALISEIDEKEFERNYNKELI